MNARDQDTEPSVSNDLSSSRKKAKIDGETTHQFSETLREVPEDLKHKSRSLPTRDRQDWSNIINDQSKGDSYSSSHDETKCVHPFLKIPTDILNSIFDLLEPTDLLQFSLTSREIRTFLLPYIFNSIRIDWKQVEDPFKYCELVRQLRIVDCNSYGEWHVDIFAKLKRFQGLQRFQINSSNSSNWLKYRSNQDIKELTLYFDRTQTSSARGLMPGNTSIYAIPGNSVHVGGHLTGSSSGSPRIFSLGHIHQFSVSTLTLYNYHFNWEPSSIITNKIINLTVHDCTWEYPFSLSQFNQCQNLKNLKLCYSTNNSFILSERFNKFLLNDDEGTRGDFDSVDSLSVVFISRENSWDRMLSAKQLSSFVTKYPNLRALKLHGWSVHTSSLMLMFQNYLEHKLQSLDLSVNVSRNYNISEVDGTLGTLKALYPWTKVKLSLVES